MLTYKQKLEQANREARAAVIGLAVTVMVWIACGFGLAGFDVQVFHTPLWVVGGTLGTWACAIAVSVVLARRVFADFDLDDGASGAGVSGTEEAGAGKPGAGEPGVGKPAAGEGAHE